MKNLGRRQVVTRSVTVELDGRETARPDQTVQQTVYQRADGTFCINHMGGKADVFPQEDGSFLKPWRAVRGVSVITGEELVDMLKGRMDTEGSVRIVDMFDGDRDEAEPGSLGPRP